MSMFPIASQVFATGATSMTFSIIPQTFTHLQLRIFTRSAVAVTAHDMNIFFNTTSGSNMTQHLFYGDGSSAYSSAGYALPNSASQIAWVPGASATANVFGISITDILDYTNTNKNKTFKTISGFDANGSGDVSLMSGMVMATGAINSIQIFVGGGGGNMIAGSRFDLYGISTSNATGA